MIKKLLTPFLVTIVGLLVMQVAFAANPNPSAPLKIGVVDLQKIMQKSSQVAAINNQLEKRFKPRQQAILASRKALQQKAEKLSRNAAVMSETDRAKLQNELIAERANLQTTEVSYQQDVTADQTKETQNFMRKLKNVVTQVAQSGGYTLIMVKQGVPYVDDKLEVTDAVLAALEKSR